MAEIGDIIDGKYRVLRTLGAGGMGVVFEALHLATERRLALKWLRSDVAAVPEAAERLMREARASGRIHHPNVVAVHDVGRHEDQLYLVMELLHGMSLRTFIKGRTFSPRELCAILFPVLRGVAAAHALGILHRDLKPENIFLAASPDGLDPVPKVLDFGLARFTDTTEHVTLSAAGALLGTFQYMAPEQLRGSLELDARADVYALGAVAYEMLTGELPYVADNPVDLALKLLEGEAPPVTLSRPELPEALADAISRALSRNRDERFGNVAELAVALEPFAGGTMFRGSSAPRPADSVLSTPAPESRVRASESLRTPYMVSSAARAAVSQPAPARFGRTALGIGLATLALGGVALATLLPSDGAPPTSSPAPGASAPAPLPEVPAATPVQAASPRPQPAVVEPRATEPLAAEPTPSAPRDAPWADPGAPTTPAPEPPVQTATPAAPALPRAVESEPAPEAAARRRPVRRAKPETVREERHPTALERTHTSMGTDRNAERTSERRHDDSARGGAPSSALDRGEF